MLGFTLLVTLFGAVSEAFASAAACNATCQSKMEKDYINNVRDRLLVELHMRAIPHNVTRPNLTEEQIEDLLGDEYDKDDFEEKKVVILPATCLIDVDGCFRLPISQSTRSTLMRGVLRFTVRFGLFDNMQDLQRGEERLITVTIRRVYTNGLQEEVITETVSALTTQKFDVELSLDEMKGWSDADVAGLTITAEHDSESHILDPSFTGSGAALILHMEPALRRGRRHGENYCTPDATTHVCCLHDMIVDFAKLGWTFIMAPKKYNAYMCRGECLHSSGHTVRFGHSKLIKDAFIGGLHCCHPSEYESLKIIYTRSDNEIVITRVPGMIARRCACT